jgi:cupin fold WbuC family metalloprotein
VESFHIIEGSADVVFFDDNGRVTGVVSLGDYMSGRCFYCRLDNDIFHTLLIHSDHIVFHETTTGPFNRASTVFAQWSPAEEETQTVIMYLKQLTTLVNNYPVG